MKVLSCTAAGYGYIGRLLLELEGETAEWIPTRATRATCCQHCDVLIDQHESCWRALNGHPARLCERCVMTGVDASA